MPTIQKRGDTYRITVSNGYDASGKQLRKSTTWKPAPGMTQKQIQKELDRQAVLFEEKVKSGTAADSSMKLSALADLWMEQHCKKQLAPKSIAENEKLLKRVVTAMGHLHVDKIKPFHIQQFYDNLAEDGMNAKTGGRLSNSTIMHYHRLLSSMFNRAVLWGIMPVSPLKVQPPKMEQKEAAHLEEDQAAALLDALEDEPIQYRTMVYLLLFTGLRKGELLGLEWQDIDFDRGLMQVLRSSQYIPKVGIITKAPKNKKSQRAIKMPNSVVDMLREYRVWQAEQRLLAGDRWEDCGRLFTTWDGHPMHPDTLPRWFDKFLKRRGLPDINIHGLRHTCASLMIAKNVDIRTVSKRLGHAQVSTTGNIYAHQIQSADEAAADVIELALNRKRG
ncbi:tyrosine-type recombinase/integrase [Anaeromassilibacillus sp. SJQ-5]